MSHAHTEKSISHLFCLSVSLSACLPLSLPAWKSLSFFFVCSNAFSNFPFYARTDYNGVTQFMLYQLLCTSFRIRNANSINAIINRRKESSFHLLNVNIVAKLQRLILHRGQWGYSWKMNWRDNFNRKFQREPWVLLPLLKWKGTDFIASPEQPRGDTIFTEHGLPLTSFTLQKYGCVSPLCQFGQTSMKAT